MTARTPGSARRRSVALLVTLLLLGLLTAAAAQLSAITSVHALEVGRRANRLQHELAVDSLVRSLALELDRDDRLEQDLDRLGFAIHQLTLGSVRVRCRVVDDAAKLDVHAFAKPRQLIRKLDTIAHRFQLPRCRIELRPFEDARADSGKKRYRWFDQLFDHAAPAAFFGADGPGSTTDPPENPVWSQVITVFGDGRIDLRRVTPNMLRVAVDDIQPGLAGKLLSARSRSKKPDENFLVQALAALDDDLRRQVRDRLAFDLHRYAITCETSIGGDRRRWYVVATIHDRSVEFHYRGQIQW